MTAAARPAGVRAWSRARPASRTRRSGRCSAGTGSPAVPRPVKEPANSYEWPCPGDLLHMDTSRYARFLRPGSPRHRRPLAALAAAGCGPRRRVGYDYAHAIVDDHSRLAYVELHDDEKAPTVTGFVERALAFFAEHGIDCEAADDRQRLQLRQEPLTARAARPPRHPPPHHPALPAPHQRQGRALPPDDGPRVGLRPRLPHASTPPTPPCHTGSTHYNRRRPHSSLGDRPPISRVHNVRG